MRSLPVRARLYIAVMSLAALAATAWAARGPRPGTEEILLAVGLTCAAALAQAFEVHMPRNKAYNATLAFLVAAALLVGPLCAALVAAVPFAVEQLHRPKPLHIQVFNGSSHVLSALAAAAAYAGVRGGWPPADSLGSGSRALGGAACAVVVFLVVNHATLAQVLLWARGVPYRESGLFGIEGMLTDATLLALGVVVAGLWSAGRGLVLFALVPFALLQRALHFPELTRASRTDPKTGLLNSAYFSEVAEDELRRASRTGQPASVVVADLDLLRNINNAYGHLAGDVVLRGIADILREEVREYDVVARFGGEEFAILLPHADLDEARQVAERIRGRVARERYAVDTSVEPIGATLSLGVAVLGEHGATLRELMHAADLAVYRAKVDGRDRVRLAGAADSPETAPQPSPRLVSPVTRVLSAAEADTAQPAPPAPGASREEHPRTPRTAPRRPTWPVTALTTAAALLLAPLTVLLHPDATWALLVFPVLALIAELSGQSIYGSSYVSLSAVPILSAVAAGRPTAALASAGVSALAGSLSRHWTAEQALFNTANYVLATAAASAVRMAAPTHPGYGVDDLVLLTGAMIVASLVYFLVDNLLVCIVVARHEGRLAGEVFRGDLAWLLPHFVVFGVFGTLLGAAWETYRFFGLLAFVLPPALVRVAQKQYLAHTVGHVAELRRLADDLAGSKAEVERANVALGEALEAVRERHLATARALARAIDARDKTTGGHIERVTALAVAMCEVVDPILAQNPQVAFGFLLHDVGKIGVPDAVLLKPGPLNQRELRVMRKHPTIGEALLTDAGFADVAREIVLTHHERWDGTGYPRGLKETEIPLCSRVFAVADSLDAMTNDRPYRLGIGLDAALAELRRNAGSQFDPLAVEALLTIPHERIEELLQLGREADRALADLLG